MENTSDKRGGYYAVIPANVRYDKSLNAQCKLLYGEITALTSAYGYCWATNGYFSELYGVDEATVSRWIKRLADKNYIKPERVRKSDGTFKQRKIYIVDESPACRIELNEPSENIETDHMTELQCGVETDEDSHMTELQCGAENGENNHIAKMQYGQKTPDNHIANLQNSHIAKMQDNNNIYNGKIRKDKPSYEGVNAHAHARDGNLPPTLEQVQAYCHERRNNVDARRFFDFYQSNGWRVGKNPMRDWQAALRRWETSAKGTDDGRIVYERYSADELNAMFTQIVE